VGNQTYRDKAIRQKGNSPEQALRSLRTTE
jgi:hypothetical protein